MSYEFPQHIQPNRFFLVCIREEHDLLLVRENEPERPLNTVHGVEVIDVPILHLHLRRPRVLLIVLDRNGLLQVNGCRRAFRHVVERNEVASDDSQLPPSPCRAIAPLLRQHALVVRRFMPRHVS